MNTRIQNQVTIIGGGLAGCEAAWQAAEAGMKVLLYEMRPLVQTGAHKTGDLAELICSNSLGSNLPDRATGLLLNELRSMGSMLIAIADQVKVPAGGALAVDRELFAKSVTEKIGTHPNITLIREEVHTLPNGPTIIASGPLTSGSLLQSIGKIIDGDSLFFYDAIAPIIEKDSINFNIAFKGSRYNRGSEEEGDYINCPLNREQYQVFISALVQAERIVLHAFESEILDGVKAGDGIFFERCLPIEILASRGEMTMAYGPMRPVGITDPKTGRWPAAVVQLRQENLLDDAYNLVGFQTNLTFPEQKRVFRLIPGLENAEFSRYGQMHRNTFLCAPRFLDATLQHRTHRHLFFAGQLIGVEGYAGNIASGLLAGRNIIRMIRNQPLLELPATTMTGAIFQYLAQAEPEHFQPMKANFGLLPAPISSRKLAKRVKYQRMVDAANQVLSYYKESVDWTL